MTSDPLDNMATEIEADARLILMYLAKAPRDSYVEASQITRDLSMEPDRVNDATAFLVESLFVDWNQPFGTAPFDFLDVTITSRGRRQAQTLAASSSANRKPDVPRSTLRLFISHSSEDVELARAIVELLATALNLSGEAIRCTSVDGYRLHAGANTNDELRREVHEATAFIGIVSHSSMRSMYVFFELGARWGAGKNLIPLLAHGVSTGVMGGPLSGLNALRADSRAQLHQLVDDLGQQLSITPQRPAVFDRALQAVLQVPQATAVAPQGNAPVAVSLSEPEERMLIQLSNYADDPEAEELAGALELSQTRAQYLLDLLEQKTFIGSRAYVDRPNEYYLKREGRQYLVERGLVS